MGVSSVSNSSAPVSAPIEAQKKATEVQERQVSQLLESANEQSKQVSSQKTGVGSNLNLTA